jgi:hypothetical protein
VQPTVTPTVPPTPLPTATNTPLPTATNTPLPTATPVQSGDLVYFSTLRNTAVSGVPGTNDDADIFSWNGSTYARFFDASAAGLPGNADIDGLVVIDANTIYMSFNRNGGVNVPGIGTVQDEDIVLYDAGSWSLYLDGSAVGLSDSNGEDIDAFEIINGTTLILSTVGNVEPSPSLPGTQRDEDVLQCVHNGIAPITSCSWSEYFDGSDIALNNSGNEDVKGIALNGTGDLVLSTYGDYVVPGLSGDGNDIFTCNGTTTGSSSACTFFSLFMDGGTGIPDTIDAIDLP